MANLQQIAVALLLAGVAAYYIFGRSTTKALTPPPLINAVNKQPQAQQSAGRDFVKAMELAVSYPTG